MKLTESLIFLFLITLALAQTEAAPSKLPINLNILYNITVEKGMTAIYTVTIKGLKNDDSFFVEAASPIYDPY